MSERPILFSGPMVRAILDGPKTQTRRVLKRLRRFGAVIEFGRSDTPGYDWHFRDRRMLWHDLRHAELLKHLPYAVGDRLWVREVWRGHVDYDGWPPSAIPVNRTKIWHEADESRDNADRIGKLRPSIYMPKWATRIWLEVTGVRVERVQEISTRDAIREGIEAPPAYMQRDPNKQPQALFRDLWDSLNAQRGYGWDANPWVTVVEFKRIAP